MVTACPIEWEPLDTPASVAWFVVPVVPVAGPGGSDAARASMDHGTTETTDEELMGGIARGDAEAFARFYDRHAGLLFSVAVHILRDDAEAEDVLQEAMVGLWERAALYDAAHGKPLSWAVALTRNRAIDRLRSLKRRGHSRTVEIDEADAVSDEASGAVFRLVASESAETLGRSLARLPEDQRQAIELAFFHGLTHVEIAERVEAPLGTIKARIRRGMLELRDALEGTL